MFITLEGVEGSGKTSQMENISRFLREYNHDVIITREPGSTNIGKKIRAILLNPDHTNIADLCELLLYGADRAQHLGEVVLPALEQGKTVLCDRFIDSTTAYQGFARGLNIDVINTIHNLVLDQTLCIPDITFLFDLDPAQGLARTFKALDSGERSNKEARFEQESLEFHRKVRNGYLSVAKQNPNRFTIIDASTSQDNVYKEVISKLNTII